jgi:spore coat polysaccharide biosynthesis protein SpsF
MKVVAVVQARYDSEFYPGKVTHQFCGKAMLTHVCERVRRCARVDERIVAVPQADAMLRPLVPEDWDFFRARHLDDGDLVSRILLAADSCDADLVVRICADNPCLSPEAIDQLIAFYVEHPSVFLSNTVLRVGEQLVDGLGAEVLSYSRLKWLNDKLAADDARHREHPHLYFHEQGYGPIGLPEHERLPILRLDVDTVGDAEFIGGIYTHCYPKNPQFGIEEILAYLHEKQQNQAMAL